MSDDEYQTMCERDFNHDDNDPRLTRIITPKESVFLTRVDEITETLLSTSMKEESESESEGEECKFNYCKGKLFADQKENIEPIQTTKAKKGKSNVAIVKPNTKTNDGKLPSRSTTQKKTRARKIKKVIEKEDDEEEYSSDDCQSTLGKQTSPDLRYGSSMEINQVPEHKLDRSIDNDQVLVKEDEIYDGESSQDDADKDKNPFRAQTKKATKETTKKSKVVQPVDLFKNDSNDMERKQEDKGKKGIKGKGTTVTARNTSEQREKKQRTVQNDRTLKSSKIVPKTEEGEPETQGTLDIPEEIHKTIDKKKGGIVIPDVPQSNYIKKENQQEDETNEDSENDYTSPYTTENTKTSKNKKLRINEPNDPSSVNGNKTTLKKTQKPKGGGRNENDANELVDDDIVVSPLPAKGRQKNSQRDVKPKEKQPLKELNTAVEPKPVPKKKKIKPVPQEGNIEIGKYALAPETKPAPKKRNIKIPPEIDANPEENKPTEKIVSKAKNVRSNEKKNEIDKELKQTTKSRKAAVKMQEAAPAKETATEETSKTSRKAAIKIKESANAEETAPEVTFIKRSLRSRK